jgi:hypothetical protein
MKKGITMQANKRLILLRLGVAPLLPLVLHAFLSEDSTAAIPAAIENDASQTSSVSIQKEPVKYVVPSTHEKLVLVTGSGSNRIALPQGTKPLANQEPLPSPGEALKRPAPPVEDSPILPWRK